MHKMNKNFFRYTISLIAVAIIFIVIGGISLSRTRNYTDTRVIGAGNISVLGSGQSIDELSKENMKLKEKLEKIEKITQTDDKDALNKIKDIVKEK